MERTNGGKNKGICHNYRQPGQQLSTCLNKKRCPDCGDVFMEWMEVEKTANIGRLFFCCTRDCGFFEWSNVAPNKRVPLQDKGQSSGVKNERETKCDCSAIQKADNQTEDLSGLFKTCTRIIEQFDVEISINITFHKGKGDVAGNDKQKGSD